MAKNIASLKNRNGVTKRYTTKRSLTYDTLPYETLVLRRRYAAQLFLLFFAPCDVVRSTVAMHDVKYLGVAKHSQGFHSVRSNKR